MKKLDEKFYERICRAYINTMNLEFVFVNPENNNSIAHGYFIDDETANKYGKIINSENYREYASADFNEEMIYEYDTWEDFYEQYVKDEIQHDLWDIGIDGVLDYLSKEDLAQLELEGYRICSECGKAMNSGYCVHCGEEYYCSDECLHKHYSEEEWNEMYENDEDTYWTEWEE